MRKDRERRLLLHADADSLTEISFYHMTVVEVGPLDETGFDWSGVLACSEMVWK